MSLKSLLVALAALNDAAITSAAPAKKTDRHVIDLKRSASSPASSRALLKNRAASTARLSSVEDGAGYAVRIKFGAHHFTVVFDTGSSDLWLPASNFQCLDSQGQDATGQCGLGPAYTGDFTGGSIPKENFNISYGDGEFLTGTLGYETVCLANITVPRQESALVTTGYWSGTGDISGLMGFAYPLLTSAFDGANPSADNILTNQAAYDPWFFNAINQGLVEPVFSLSLGRGDNAGHLALGGVAAADVKKKYASTPLETLQINPNIQGSAKNFSYYTIIPTAYNLNDETATAAIPMIVDSGTTLTYFPPDLASAINAAFDPPSQYIADEGVFENFCDATPPDFSISIGDQAFTMSAQDLLLSEDVGYDSSTGGCLTGVQAGGESGPYILGDTFLRNVVAVFDVGKSEMRFAQK